MNKELANKIKILSEQVYEEALTHRKHLHAYPELSWQESQTSKYIQDFLQKENIEYSIIASYGIVGNIKCKNPESRCIALRADMDALPIQEENEVSYKSCNDGVMHACGHDVHMACLMGAIKVIKELKNEIEGTIKFIFQPSEEKQPSGAQKMIEEGVLENPKVDEIYGLHVTPELECGKIGYRAGKFMASADEIYITIKGPGGHASQPHKSVDTILVASHVIVALQQIVSRNADPLMPTVLSFGDIHGYGATNIIPTEVKIKGTLRTFDETWRSDIHEKIISITKGISEGMGATCEIEIPEGLPYVLNDEFLINQSINKLQHLFDNENLIEMPIRMGAEDFAYYSHQVPSCFYRLGTSNNNTQLGKKLHTSIFNIDDSSIKFGVMLLVSSIV